MKSEIIIQNLKKTYRIPLRNPGVIAAMKSLIHPVFNNVPAVDDISFEIQKGEIVGFVGPNGAGKTTTLKMLSGLLYPSSGKVQVSGFIPYERKPEFLRRIGFVMGNKSQLTWDNTILDSFFILKEIYNVPKDDFKKRMNELVGILQIEELLPKLARNLSLGERAKCEITAALLHNPDVLFLDEPTLGLDVSMQLKLRDFVKEYNKEHGTTIILTSHYMGDITSLCKRIILINDGKLAFDGELAQLSDKIAPFKLIRVTAKENELKFGRGLFNDLKWSVDILEQDQHNSTIRVKKENISDVMSFLMNNLSISDLTVEDPPIEAVMDQIYRREVEVCT